MPMSTYQHLFPTKIDDFKVLYDKLIIQIKNLLQKIKTKFDSLMMKIHEIFSEKEIPQQLKTILESIYGIFIYLTVPILAICKGGKKDVLEYDETCLL